MDGDDHFAHSSDNKLEDNTTENLEGQPKRNDDCHNCPEELRDFIDKVIGEKLWDDIGKNLEDFTLEDMSRLSFTSLEDDNHTGRGENPGDPVLYRVAKAERPDLWYLVINDAEDDNMYCSCQKLESVGFPCRHMFAVMKMTNMSKIPSACILKRWTMEAKTGITVSHTTSKKPSQRIGDPAVVVSGRGKRKRGAFTKETQQPKDVAQGEVKKEAQSFDLNVTPKPSPTKPHHKTNLDGETVINLAEWAKQWIPHTFIPGDITESG